ncbi:hypothetical protein B0O99DRAFT_713139, partial [Bisporella sp. PMI_857]
GKINKQLLAQIRLHNIHIQTAHPSHLVLFKTPRGDRYTIVMDHLDQPIQAEGYGFGVMTWYKVDPASNVPQLVGITTQLEPPDITLAQPHQSVSDNLILPEGLGPQVASPPFKVSDISVKFVPGGIEVTAATAAPDATSATGTSTTASTAPAKRTIPKLPDAHIFRMVDAWNEHVRTWHYNNPGKTFEPKEFRIPGVRTQQRVADELGLSKSRVHLRGHRGATVAGPLPPAYDSVMNPQPQTGLLRKYGFQKDGTLEYRPPFDRSSGIFQSRKRAAKKSTNVFEQSDTSSVAGPSLPQPRQFFNHAEAQPLVHPYHADSGMMPGPAIPQQFPRDMGHAGVEETAQSASHPGIGEPKDGVFNAFVLTQHL